MVAFVFDRRSLVLLGTGAVFLALVLVAVGFLLGVQYGVLPPAALQASTAQAGPAMLPARVTGMGDDPGAPDTAGPDFGGEAEPTGAGAEPAEGEEASESMDATESLPYADAPAGDETSPADEPAAAPSPSAVRSAPSAASSRFEPPSDPIIDSRGGEPVALAPSPPSAPDRMESEANAASPPTEGAAPDAPAAVPAAVTSDSGRFAVQVGAYRERLNSDAMVQKLAARGFESYVVEIQREGQPPLFAVRVGRFGDRASAAKAASALRSRAGVSVVVLSIG